MFLDIVILPPKNIREKIGSSAALALKRVRHGLIVDNKKFIPHLSLFHIRTASRKLPELYRIIHEILLGYSPMKIRKKKFYAVKNWVCFEASSPKAVTRLHREILNRCYQLRTAAMPSTSRTLLVLEKSYRKKYGSKHILKYFHPHFTLGRIKNMNDEMQVSKQLKKVDFQFIADTVAVCAVNFNLQVTKILKTFKLQ